MAKTVGQDEAEWSIGTEAECCLSSLFHEQGKVCLNRYKSYLNTFLCTTIILTISIALLVIRIIVFI